MADSSLAGGIPEEIACVWNTEQHRLRKL